jgi:hypothetical protein
VLGSVVGVCCWGLVLGSGVGGLVLGSGVGVWCWGLVLGSGVMRLHQAERVSSRTRMDCEEDAVGAGRMNCLPWEPQD